MRKKLLISLAMVLVIPGFLFTVSCAKKTIRDDTALAQQAEDQAAAEKAKQEELARQRAIEEQRLKEEAESEAAARNMFLNEDIFFEFDSACRGTGNFEEKSGMADKQFRCCGNH